MTSHIPTAMGVHCSAKGMATERKDAKGNKREGYRR